MDAPTYAPTYAQACNFAMAEVLVMGPGAPGGYCQALPITNFRAAKSVTLACWPCVKGVELAMCLGGVIGGCHSTLDRNAVIYWS